ncbi:MAG: hypothetical protein EOO61_03855 [Hymenobacter sp.]|nr:MAG: hypothetical protein EOO61_03855 [Hymenobacter sp.]
MQYSIVNGLRVEAKPNLRGTCICCQKSTHSACGKLITWHWRHVNKKECDNWWESETEWHREWKSKFPEAWREVIQYDNSTNEKHIADIKTNRDVVLEFQNSPISLEELLSRERFYKKMIWVVNGLHFKENFEFGYKLPNPKSSFPKRFRFIGWKHTIAYDRIEYPEGSKMVELLGRIEGIPIQQFVERYHTRHFTFNWKKIRQVWQQAQMPVFIDFNDGVLWRVEFKTSICDSPVCSYYSKAEFIRHYTE